MSQRIISILFFVAITEVGSVGWAQAAAKAVAGPKAENLLDFEAEVIEGERKRPELFLNIKAGDGKVGSGLYLRPNFDDFFAVDKKRRPRFIKSK